MLVYAGPIQCLSIRFLFHLDYPVDAVAIIDFDFFRISLLFQYHEASSSGCTIYLPHRSGPHLLRVRLGLPSCGILTLPFMQQ